MTKVFRSEWEEIKFSWYAEYVEFCKRPIKYDLPVIRVSKGDHVHLKTKSGSYQIIKLDKQSLTISCKEWIKQYKRGERKEYIEKIHISAVRCLHGKNSQYRRFNFNVMDAL